MKILVLAENYTRPDGFIALHYIHTRNKRYVEKGIDVSVISFKAKENYIIDGVKVYTINSYLNNLIDINYDILLSHAPNLKNHYRFLKKYGNRFKSFVFFFHGHEVLRTSELYPEPYYFIKESRKLARFSTDIYDRIKLKVWNNFFVEVSNKSQFVFVSSWMYEMFIANVRINPKVIKNNSHIIYNSIGNEFESIKYDLKSNKIFDFITIRNNLDGSKYAIDIVTNLAEKNPKYKFCVIGKGDFYKHIKKPNNLLWIDKNLTHEEIIGYLNQSECALIPTRTDAQGVMACEMATFGIPIITSNIDVCKEVFEGFNNVNFIDNDKPNANFNNLFENNRSTPSYEKNTKYYSENTIGKEINLFTDILNRKN